MKTLLIALLLATLAIALAILLHASSGTVVILSSAWRADLAMPLALAVLLVGLWVSYRLGRLTQRMIDFPDRVRAYRERRSELSALRALRDALKALIEGRFARAERAARRAQKESQVAGIAALLGARAAHRLQQFERREQWLETAERDPELSVARLILSAEMWLEQRDNSRALRAIAQLHRPGARHIHALRIALMANLHAHHWHDALRILRVLEKHRGLADPVRLVYKSRIHRGLITECGDTPGALDRAWDSIAPTDRVQADLALEAARAFHRDGRADIAGRILEDALNEGQDPRLWDELARAEGDAVAPRLARLEKWLGSRVPDAAALRCLGILCLKAQLWGKAGTYLEDSHRREPHPECTLALAELAQALGDRDKALSRFQESALAWRQQSFATTNRPLRGIRRESAL